MKIIQWGILGCGDVTEKKSGPALSKIPGSQLVAVMRRDAARAADYAARHRVPWWTTDVRELIHHPEVNAVYVATPPSSHAELALAVLAAGKPCYVEKPMAANAGQARVMRDAFAAAKMPLFVAYYRRALPRFEYVRDLLRQRALGTVTELRYRYADGQHLRPGGPMGWRFDPAISGGGLLLDLGSHALDLFDYWFGPLGDVAAQVRFSQKPGIEENVTATFSLPGGGVASAAWNFASPQPEDLVEIFGTEGAIRCSIFGHEPVRVFDSAGIQREHSFEVPEHIQQPLLEEVVRSLQTGAPCRSTGNSATRTNEVLKAILHS